MCSAQFWDGGRSHVDSEARALRGGVLSASVGRPPVSGGTSGALETAPTLAGGSFDVVPWGIESLRDWSAFGEIIASHTV